MTDCVLRERLLALLMSADSAVLLHACKERTSRFEDDAVYHACACLVGVLRPRCAAVLFAPLQQHACVLDTLTRPSLLAVDVVSLAFLFAPVLNVLELVIVMCEAPL